MICLQLAHCFHPFSLESLNNISQTMCDHILVMFFISYLLLGLKTCKGYIHGISNNFNVARIGLDGSTKRRKALHPIVWTISNEVGAEVVPSYWSLLLVSRSVHLFHNPSKRKFQGFKSASLKSERVKIKKDPKEEVKPFCSFLEWRVSYF